MTNINQNNSEKSKGKLLSVKSIISQTCISELSCHSKEVCLFHAEWISEGASPWGILWKWVRVGNGFGPQSKLYPSKYIKHKNNGQLALCFVHMHKTQHIWWFLFFTNNTTLWLDPLTRQVTNIISVSADVCRMGSTAAQSVSGCC